MVDILAVGIPGDAVPADANRAVAFLEDDGLDGWPIPEVSCPEDEHLVVGCLVFRGAARVGHPGLVGHPVVQVDLRRGACRALEESTVGLRHQDEFQALEESMAGLPLQGESPGMGESTVDLQLQDACQERAELMAGLPRRGEFRGMGEFPVRAESTVGSAGSRLPLRHPVDRQVQGASKDRPGSGNRSAVLVMADRFPAAMSWERKVARLMACLLTGRTVASLAFPLMERMAVSTDVPPMAWMAEWMGG